MKKKTNGNGNNKSMATGGAPGESLTVLDNGNSNKERGKSFL